MTDALTEDRTGGPAPDAPAAGAGGAPPPPPPPGAARGPWFAQWPARAWVWFTHLPVEGYVTLGIVAFCVGFTFLQLGPGDVLSDTTPTGGDMGAHVWGPAFLRDHLLPSGRLSGWTPDWYAGFPAYQFYMVPPALAIALLSYVIPYGTAFKLAAISGALTLPVAAWAFGRLTRLPFPVPPLLAVAATMFLFDRSYSILGGNLASTFAGEFSFSITLSLVILYFGVLGRGLETGRHRFWAALLLGLIAVCHPIPLIFAVIGTGVWFLLSLSWSRLRLDVGLGLGGLSLFVGWALTRTDLFLELADGTVRLLVFWGAAAVLLLAVAVVVAEFPRGQVVYLVTTIPVAVAISAWWTVPFYLRHGYMNDMGWDKVTTYGELLFSREADALRGLGSQGVDAPAIKWVLALAAVGVLMALVALAFDRNRSGLFFLGTAVVCAIAFVVVPQGRVWNARLLPFYYLSLYFLAAIGVGYVARVLAMLVARDPRRPVRTVGVVAALVGAAVGLTALAMPLRAMPWGQTAQDGTYSWGPLTTSDRSFIPSWARWNFEGYEGKQDYPEYQAIVSTMAGLGETRGCGQAMWEHESEHNRFGTPMALMLLPFWTDGCIGSMEGLYFEASSTTPYHFINQDELSTAPSNPQRDLPYGPGQPSQADFERGIDHLQMLGVRYYMAISDRMIDFARRNPDLTEVAASGPWVVFEVAGSELVAPLANEPAVMTGLPDTGHGWLERSMDWYVDPRAWPVYLADDGPASWERVGPGQEPAEVPVEPVTVSNIEAGTDTISFDVSEPGTPVLVKASYFPNWHATGADGPWRVTPNLMVVVPTSTHVELSYGWTWVDGLGWGLTALGLGGLGLLAVAGPVAMPVRLRPEDEPGGGEVGEEVPAGGGPPPADGGDDAAGPAAGDPTRPRGEGIAAADFDPTAAILGPLGGPDPTPGGGGRPD